MAIEDFVVRLKANVSSYIKGVKKATDTTDLYVDALGRTRDANGRFVKGAKTAVKAATKMESSFSGVAANTIALNQATQLLNTTYAISAKVVGSLVSPYAAYEKALVGVGKTTNIAGAELNALGASLQGIAERIPVSTNELLTIGQAAGQLGVTGADNIANFAETIAKLGSASDLSGEEAATALTRVLNVTGQSVDQVDEFASVIVRLGNNFAATESEIARMATEVSRATAVFGVSAEDSAALGAAMRSVGIQAELGGSSVGKAFQAINRSIQKGGAEMEALTELTGKTADEITKAFAEDSTAAFQMFIEGLGNIPANEVAAELEKFGLKGEEINKTLPVLAQRADLVGKAIGSARKEMKDATALNAEANTAFKTLDSQIKITANVFTNLASDIGKQLAPAFSAFLSTLRDLAPVVRAAFGAISSVDFKGVISTFKETGDVIATVMVPALIALNPQLLKTAAASALIAAKFLAIGAVIGGAVVAIDLLIRNAQRIGDVFTVVVGTVRKVMIDMVSFIIKEAGKLVAMLSRKLGGFIGIFSTDMQMKLNDIAMTTESTAASLAETADQMSAELGDSIEKAGEGLDLGILGKIMEEGTKALDKFNGTLETTAKTSAEVKKNLEGAKPGEEGDGQPGREPGADIKAVKTELFDDNSLGVMKDAFGGAFAEGASSISSSIGSSFMGPIAAAQGIVNVAQGLVDAVPNLLNSFAGLLDSITNFPQILTDAIKNVLGSIISLVSDFIPNIINAIPEIVDAFFDFFATGLPDAALKLGEGIVDALTNLIDRLPDLLVKGAMAMVNLFIGMGPVLAVKLITGILKGMPKLIKALGQAIPEIIPAIIEGIKEGLFNLVGDLGEQTEKSFQVLGEKLTGASQQMFEVIEGTVAARGTDTADKIRDSIASSMRGAVDFLTKAWHEILKFFTQVWEFVLGLFEAVIAILDAVWKFVLKIFDEVVKFLGQVWEAALKVFDEIVKFLAQVWDFILQVLEGLIKLLESVWNAVLVVFENIVNALKIVWDTVLGLFKNVIDAFESIWKTMMDIFSGKINLLEGVGKIFETIFEAGANALRIVGEGLGKLFDNLVDGLGKVLTEIGKGIGEFLKPVTDLLSNLGSKLAEGLTEGLKNVTNVLSQAFKFDGKGKGSVEKLLNIDVPFVAFNKGGVVPGMAPVAGDSMQNDKVMAFLSPGEIVLPRSIAQNEKIMNAVMQAIEQRGNIPQFGFGGFVKKLIKGDVQGAKEEAAATFKTPSSMEDLLQSVGKDIGFLRDKVVEGLQESIRGTTARLGFQQGGAVPGVTDTVPALLSPGEFIISQGAADAIGLDTLRQINNSGIVGGGGITNVTDIQEGAVQVTVNADSFDESFVRNEMMDIVKEELRQATNGGESIISERGVF